MKISYLPIFLFTTYTFLMLFTPLKVVAQIEMTTEKWREDLRHMSEELPKRHINLFHSMTQDAFERAVGKLDERIPELQDHQIIVEFSRIAAMIGDGHSGIRLYDDPNIAFSSCPIRFYLYQDGLFVQRADRAFSEVVGARVTKIGNVSVDKAINLVRELISRDNEMYVKLFAPFLLTSPEILHALGINENINQATYVFEVEGEDLTVSMEPKGNLRLTGHAHYDSGMDAVDWVDARDASDKATPLWLKGDVRKSYWFEYLEEKRTVYFRFNEILNKKEESIFTFADRLSEFIADNDVNLLVVDLRWNDGGDNQFTRPILRSIIQSRKIDKRGKLFVIIGRRTFSAAQTFVNELEMYTNVLFVGEPTAEKVNNYGDTYKIKLPNSRITVKASFIRFQQMDQRDTRQWTTPHLRTALTSEDYRNNSDPAMQAVLVMRFVSNKLTKPQNTNDNFQFGQYHYRTVKRSNWSICKA
jgi:hypothetical protein